MTAQRVAVALRWAVVVLTGGYVLAELARAWELTQ